MPSERNLQVSVQVDASRFLEGVVRAQVQLEHQQIEMACEKALQGGQYGVLVVRDEATFALVSAEPDPRVPYGTIHEWRGQPDYPL